MDTNIDYRVSVDEINRYIKIKKIPLDIPETGQKLFEEITEKRTVIHER